MGLLLADLRAIGNGLSRRDAHGGLAARVLPPLLLGGMYGLLGSTMLAHPELLPALHRHGNAQSILVAASLSPCPIVAGWIAFAHVHRQLFEGPELPLWFLAPMWRGRAALQVFARAVVVALLWAIALSAPFAAQLLHAGRAPLFAWALLPLAVATAVVPSLGASLALQILLMRCAGGRAARTLLSLLSALASFGFPVFLLAEVFVGAPARVLALEQPGAVDRGASPLVATAADLLAAAARGVVDGGALRSALLLLGATLVLFVAVAPLHPVAAQNHLLAYRPRRRRGGSWPVTPAASIRHKELTQTLQQPGALWQMVIVAAMCLLASQQPMIREILEATALPRQIRQIAAMAALWCLAVTMLLYTHMGRLAIFDGPQWPLYLQAPLAPATLLRGKLAPIALLLAWPAAVAAFAGMREFGADLLTVATFAGFAAAGTLAALAVIAAIGTWPWLVRRELDGRLTQGSRGLVGSLALMTCYLLAVAPGYVAYRLALAEARTQRPDFGPLLPLALGAAFALGALEFAAAGWLAVRNYRRLLAPR
jgi:hypothetical protein